MVSQLVVDCMNENGSTKFSTTSNPPLQSRNSSVLSPVILVIYYNPNSKVLQGSVGTASDCLTPPPIRGAVRNVETSGLFGATTTYDHLFVQIVHGGKVFL
jgi:hypothetical protein